MNPSLRSIPLLLLFPLLAASGGCDLVESDSFRNQERRLDRAMAQWEAEGPSAYRMVYQRTCFCFPDLVQPVELRVQGGEVEDRRFVASNAPVPEEFAELYLPVPEIFEEIREAIRRRVAVLEVEYDPALGFPLEVFIDPRVDMVDDEVGHRVLALVPTP